MAAKRYSTQKGHHLLPSNVVAITTAIAATAAKVVAAATASTQTLTTVYWRPDT